jgi:glycerol-3-phosphate dehydrogenase
MAALDPAYDLAIIGGGINGAGIARDAAGRGLKVLLVERGDIAGATSQWSTKLIHGGLRYLEHYEFRLVRESLVEREVLLRCAPHLVQPLAFVLPHEPHLRPAWMIRVGLFMYDHMGGRHTLPGSFGVDLSSSKWGAGLKPKFHRGFVYADARVDDARMVVMNVMAARELGADVRVRTRVAAARRDADGKLWQVTLTAVHGSSQSVRARCIVNASGPWVKEMRDTISHSPARETVRHVKGSHIVVPRVHDRPHAYILQNADQRIVFVIPYHDRYSLIGTTDIAVEEFDHPQITRDETVYLLALANTYLAAPLDAKDIVWSYSGVRPLYDDGASDPSSVTRDYVFRNRHRGPGWAAGGRARCVDLRRQAHHVSEAGRACARRTATVLSANEAGVDATKPLPGGDLPSGGLTAWIGELGRRYPALPEDCCAISRIVTARARLPCSARRGSRRISARTRPPT